MSRHWTLGLLACGPLALALATWVGQFWMWRKQKPGKMTLAALGIFGATAAVAVWNFFYYGFMPPSNLPPWKGLRNIEFWSFNAVCFGWNASRPGSGSARCSEMADGDGRDRLVATAVSEFHGCWGSLSDGGLREWLLSQNGKVRYFGNEAESKPLDIWLAKASAACCGVNLAVRGFYRGRCRCFPFSCMAVEGLDRRCMGECFVFQNGKVRYFGNEAGSKPIDIDPAKASSTCCGVNLAVGVFGGGF
jgi:hypothetical protein